MSTAPAPRGTWPPPGPSGWGWDTPALIQAWCEANELPGRELMRDGRWLV